MNAPINMGTSAISYSKKGSEGMSGKRTTYISTSDIAHSSASLTSFSTLLFRIRFFLQIKKFPMLWGIQ